MNERTLIQRSLAGETSCFEQLVVCYEERLMRFLRLRLNTQSDADDIFQETFLNAHLYLHSYNSRFAFSTWLFNIAINVIKKSKKFEREHSNQVIDEPFFEARDSNSGNIWHLAKRLLDNEQISLLWFTYAEEYTGKEVAYLLDRSLPWVKINLVRTKKLLKDALQEEKLALADLISN